MCMVVEAYSQQLAAGMTLETAVLRFYEDMGRRLDCLDVAGWSA
jgi:hypothetical protein